jgi:hypothetical protein
MTPEDIMKVVGVRVVQAKSQIEGLATRSNLLPRHYEVNEVLEKLQALAARAK